ncbi:hypothetical protein, partial [Erwinia amylovora]|uniref:hypothetical protein n=1 Tax=Erwinia amylovora TaxID=552 RepID=UPI0020C186DA
HIHIITPVLSYTKHNLSKLKYNNPAKNEQTQTIIVKLTDKNKQKTNKKKPDPGDSLTPTCI